jgi:hypothetical protein
VGVLLEITDDDLPAGEREFFWHCVGCRMGHTFKTPRWTWNGDWNKPTFNPSLVYRLNRTNMPPAVCHTFVRDGMIEYLPDCTHKLAGQKVAMVDALNDV